MRIAMIGQKGIPATYGGVEKHVHDLAAHLIKAGYEVTVYSRRWYTRVCRYTGGVRNIVDGVRATHLPSLHTKHFDTITHTFISTLHALFQRYDVIHYHGVGPALLAWIPRLFAPKTKVIITFHSIDRYHQKWGAVARFWLRLGEWSACHFAHSTITVSRSLQSYCLNEFNRETTYIPNGTNMELKTFSSDSGIQSFGLRKNNYLIMISRLVPHKGAHLLIESFINLKQKYQNNLDIAKLKLAIVGGSVYTNDYVKFLNQQAGVCNDIVFTDWQSSEMLQQLYTNALALVHPSLNEGLPISVLEAMGYGKPVLLSDIPEHLELVHDPRVIFIQNNVKNIEEKILEFLSLSETERTQIGEYNRETIQRQYSWDIVIPQIIEVYNVKRTKEKIPLIVRA